MGAKTRFRDTFQESFQDLRAVDRAAGVVRGVKILGYDSLHGRGYTDGAMANGARLYEGKVGCLNHAGGQSGRKRGAEDAFCVYHNPEFRPGQGIFADLHLIDKAAGQTPGTFEHKFISAADSPDLAIRRAFSFSPDHLVSGTPGKDGRKTVESIDHVTTVDVVHKGATTKGIFEGYDVERAQELVPPIGAHDDEPGAAGEIKDGLHEGKPYHHHIASAMHAVATHPTIDGEHKKHITNHLMKALHGPDGTDKIAYLTGAEHEEKGEFSEDSKGKQKRPAEGKGEIEPDQGTKGGTFKEGAEEMSELETLRLRERVRKVADGFGVAVDDAFLTEAVQEGFDGAVAMLGERQKGQRARDKAREQSRPRSVSRQQLQPVQEGAAEENSLFDWAPGARVRMARMVRQ